EAVRVLAADPRAAAGIARCGHARRTATYRPWPVAAVWRPGRRDRDSTGGELRLGCRGCLIATPEYGAPAAARLTFVLRVRSGRGRDAGRDTGARNRPRGAISGGAPFDPGPRTRPVPGPPSRRAPPSRQRPDAAPGVLERGGAERIAVDDDAAYLDDHLK